jgi:hypothetical protein
MLSFAARINYMKYPDGLYRGHVGIDRGTDGYRINVGPVSAEVEILGLLQHEAQQAVGDEFFERFIALRNAGQLEPQET